MTNRDSFLVEIDQLINENIAQEHFGVSELADAVGMSRSNLLRKIKTLTNLSASQYIRQRRLEKALDLLKDKKGNVSEVGYQVGFSSSSYFIKCFKEFYGYSPGEVGNQAKEATPLNAERSKSHFKTIVLVLAMLLAASIVVYIFVQSLTTPDLKERSIAVLPFYNQSADSSNVYFINGLMEATLNQLQRIEAIRVVSRTSVEKYRSSKMTLPEIANELGVNYIVEGSGQKRQGEILLNIQLIEASTDRPIWSEQYQREFKDVFDIQSEVAQNIAGKVKAVITPEEKLRMEAIPTQNLEAYDFYLQGKGYMQSWDAVALQKALECFKKAIALDPKFARPYASVASVYYILDLFQYEKQYSDSINWYADEALLLDDRFEESLVAKALYFMNIGEEEKAVPYLEKALVFNPNAPSIYNLLSDTYSTRLLDKNKYLEYALKGIRLNVTDQDSSMASYLYLHVSNALIQSGFTAEANTYIDKSLDYNQDNIFSQYVKAYIQYAADKKEVDLQNRLLKAYSQDTTRLDVLQEIGKVYYMRGKYDSAALYYKKYLFIKRMAGIHMFPGEDLKIAYVLRAIGEEAEAQRLLEGFQTFVNSEENLYTHISWTGYYAYIGDKANAMKELERFSEEKDYFFWVILFLDKDPIIQSLSEEPGYDELMQKIEKQFWEGKEKLKSSLEKQGLL